MLTLKYTIKNTIFNLNNQNNSIPCKKCLEVSILNSKSKKQKKIELAIRFAYDICSANSDYHCNRAWKEVKELIKKEFNEEYE